MNLDKSLPDPLKVIADIKRLLKHSDLSHRLKDLHRLLKDLTNLFKSYREFQPYFRKELCLLRVAIKDNEFAGDAPVKAEIENLKYRLERVNMWKAAIIKKAQETLGKNKKLLFCCIDEGTRIAVTDKPINMAMRVTEARNLKFLLLDVLNAIETSAPEYYRGFLDVVEGVIILLALDGITALQIRPEIFDLVTLISREIPDYQKIQEKLKFVNEVIDVTILRARAKRDETEKALNDIYRTMLYLDRQVDLSSRTPPTYLPTKF